MLCSSLKTYREDIIMVNEPFVPDSLNWLLVFSHCLSCRFSTVCESDRTVGVGSGPGSLKGHVRLTAPRNTDEVHHTLPLTWQSVFNIIICDHCVPCLHVCLIHS